MAALGLALWALVVAGCSGAVAESAAPADGHDLAFVRLITGNPPRHQVMLADVDGRTQGRVLASPEGVERIGGLAWTPDGSTLLATGSLGEQRFPTYVAGRSDLFALAVDSAEAHRLTRAGDAQGAAISPDGTTVLLARQTLTPEPERNSSALWLMGIDGSDLRPLLPSTAGQHDMPGAWSPDGRQIAFTRSVNRLDSSGDFVSGNTVWVVNADGTGARRIAEGRSPAWSPDGTRIAFASARDRNGEVYGGDTRRASAELYSVAPDGSDLRRITRTVHDEDAPAWSADGRWLAFQRESATGTPFTNAIWTTRPDGSCARPLALDRAGVISYQSPAWRPGAAVERDCAGPARQAALPQVPIAGLRSAKAFRGHPLYWLGPTWRGRRLIEISSSQPNPSSRYFRYGDCRTLGDDCGPVQYQIIDVCTTSPPGDRGPLPLQVTRFRIRGAPAFLGFGQWEVYTGRVMIRVFARGRQGRQLIAALRGLNAQARGLRPGRPFPPPIPGALERRLPCPTSSRAG